MNEWFLQNDIALIYNEIMQNESAIFFAAKAIINKGIIEKKIKTINLLGNLCAAQNESKNALTCLVAEFLIRKNNNWKTDDQLINCLQQHAFDFQNPPNYHYIINKLTTLCNAKVYDAKQKNFGEIFQLLPAGNAGFILAANKRKIYFSKNEFKGNKTAMKCGMKVSYYIAEGFDKKKNMKSDIAVNIQVY